MIGRRSRSPEMAISLQPGTPVACWLILHGKLGRHLHKKRKLACSALENEAQAIEWQPRLAPLGQGRSVLVYSLGDAQPNAPVGLLDLSLDGVGTARQVGQGGRAEVYADQSGNIHLAWCSPDGAVSYLPPDGSIERISFPPCRSRPGLFQDSIERVHLVWYSDQVENNFADRLPESMIYESIRTAGSWSEPAIVSSADQAATPSIATAPDGTSFISWQDFSERSTDLIVCTPGSIQLLFRWFKRQRAYRPECCPER